MENKKLTINDIIQAEGLYEGYIVSGNKLIAIVEVEALNLDLEDEFVVHSIFENYSAFLMSVKNDNETIMNISMTAKNDTEQYELYWKRKLIEVEKRNDLDGAAKENIQQLISSKILDLESHIRQNETTVKQHFMVLSQEIKGKEFEEYEAARREISDKCKRVMSELHDCLQSCNRDVEIHVANNQEALKILQHFTDNKSAMLT